MMFQWLRLPDADAESSVTNDTTEVQIGSGVDVPNWAKSILAVSLQMNWQALTTKEEMTGYFRLVNDENTIDPLNFPLPMAVCLTGAIGTHISPGHLTVPCYHSVTPNDVVRAYMALDAASTGVHQACCEVLFSDKSPPMELKSEKSAVTAFGQTPGTLVAEVAINTIANRTRDLLGFGNSFMVYPTAAESFGGHIIVTSTAAGWLKQRMPVTTLGSGLSTQITPFAMPVFMLPKELLAVIDGAYKLEFPDPFPVNTKQAFNFQNTPNFAQSVAGGGRYFLYWNE